jgi:hypothetical protein
MPPRSVVARRPYDPAPTSFDADAARMTSNPPVRDTTVSLSGPCHSSPSASRIRQANTRLTFVALLRFEMDILRGKPQDLEGADCELDTTLDGSIGDVSECASGPSRIGHRPGFARGAASERPSAGSPDQPFRGRFAIPNQDPTRDGHASFCVHRGGRQISSRASSSNDTPTTESTNET